MFYENMDYLKERLGFSKTYFNLTDVKTLYIIINNGHSDGVEQFLKEARKIAFIMNARPFRNEIVYEFRNEEALFQLLKKHLKKQMEQKGLDCWGLVMQYIS